MNTLREKFKVNKKRIIKMNIATLKIVGWLIIVFGLVTALGDGSYYKGFYVSPTIGYVEIVLGVIILLWIHKDKVNKIEDSQRPERTKDMICPKCQQVYLAGQAPKDSCCESCGVSLEPLEGFYERHPELKDAPEPFTQADND